MRRSTVYRDQLGSVILPTPSRILFLRLFDGIEQIKRAALRENDVARIGAPDRIFAG